MPQIKSQINTASPEFKANAKAMTALVEDMAAKAEQVMQGGPEASRDRHVARGKLLPRERINRLLDPGSPFLEVAPFAAWDMYGGEVPAAGIITGIGRVSGTECMVVCNDATVKGGTY
ncbi:MAG: carboxyl transferase domain-containing protein, partial [Rhodospirillales bacterium]